MITSKEFILMHNEAMLRDLAERNKAHLNQKQRVTHEMNVAVKQWINGGMYRTNQPIDFAYTIRLTEKMHEDVRQMLAEAGWDVTTFMEGDNVSAYMVSIYHKEEEKPENGL